MVTESQKKAFWYAAKNGKTEDIQTLLTQDIPIDTPVQFGQTALSTAAEYGRAKTVKFLLENGADANCRDATKFTPLMKAAMLGHKPVVYMFLQHSWSLNNNQFPSELLSDADKKTLEAAQQNASLLLSGSRLIGYPLIAQVKNNIVVTSEYSRLHESASSLET